MKKLSHRFSVLILFLLASTSFCLGQNPPPLTVHGIRVFQHGDYSDPSGYVYHTEVSDLGSWNHQISSLQVPAGYQLIAYESINYQGESRIFIGNWTIGPTDIIWNDRICSFKWMKIIYEAPAPVPGGGIKLWENENFVLPATITYKQEEPNLYFWDNRVGSIQVPEGYKMTAWEDMNFQGASIEISGNWTPGGATQGWNKRISSYKLIKTGGANPVPVDPIPNPAYEPPTRHFVSITNKYTGDGLSLIYTDQKLIMKPYTSRWKIIKAANNNFKIHIFLAGKYWALGTRQDGYIFLDTPSEDKYQNWLIEKLEDRYCRISSPSLLAEGTKLAHLFVDINKNELILMEWDVAKSLNGRWYLDPSSEFPTAITDPWDNRILSLRSVSNNVQMCLSLIYTSDITSEPRLVPCQNRNGRIIFEKTVTGDYFMKMDDNNNGRWVYLDQYLLETSSGRDMKPLPTQPGRYQTWRIVPYNNYYRIINTGTGYAMEMMKDRDGSPLVMMVPIAERTGQLWGLQ